MKKILTIILSVLMLFSVCACDGDTTSSTDTPSKDTVSEDTTSKDTSSKKDKEPVDDSACYTEDGYYMIQEAAKLIKTARDDSKLFKEGVEGYEINGGVYYVDAETMLRLTKTPCRGDGGVMLVDWKDHSIGWGDHPEQFKAAAADKLSDEVYMSMFLANEGKCFMRDQDRGYNGFPASDKYVNATAIGAIYKNYDYELPDNAAFTICIGNVKLLMKTTESDGWFVAESLPYPKMSDCMYYLPWQLEPEIGTFPLLSRTTYYDDHVEIRMKGSDFNATTAKKKDDRVQECVLHFWGNGINFDKLGVKGSEILGVVSSFDVWVKEPEYANYFVIGVGTDWRTSSGTINQAYESLKYALTTERRPAFAHNVAPSVYDEVMDVEFVKEQLGLK